MFSFFTPTTEKFLDAAKKGDVMALKHCLKGKPNKSKLLLDCQDQDTGSTALIYAAATDNLQVVHFLLAEGADASLQNKRGKTALSYALEMGNKDISTLIESNISSAARRQVAGEQSSGELTGKAEESADDRGDSAADDAAAEALPLRHSPEKKMSAMSAAFFEAQMRQQENSAAIEGGENEPRESTAEGLVAGTGIPTVDIGSATDIPREQERVEPDVVQASSGEKAEKQEEVEVAVADEGAVARSTAAVDSTAAADSKQSAPTAEPTNNSPKPAEAVEVEEEAEATEQSVQEAVEETTPDENFTAIAEDFKPDGTVADTSTTTTTKTTTTQSSGPAMMDYGSLLEPCLADTEQHKWCFLTTESIRKLGEKDPLPEFRGAFEAGSIVVVECSPFDVLWGKLNDTYVVISHTWHTPTHPDPDAIKKEVIMEFIDENPTVEGIWYDYSCLPQDKKSGGRSDKTAEEEKFFNSTLENINFLYLGGKGLVVLDKGYIDRFWTSYEFVLLLRKILVKDGSIVPCADDDDIKQRVTIMEYGQAKESPGVSKRVMKDNWWRLSLEEVVRKLKMENIVVTNRKDKEKLLPLLQELDQKVRAIWMKEYLKVDDAIIANRRANLRSDHHYDIFVSYSKTKPESEDRAAWIADVAEGHELRPFFDNDQVLAHERGNAQVGEDEVWATTVIRSDVCVTVLDDVCFQSRQVREQNQTAYAAGIPIILILDGDRYSLDSEALNKRSLDTWKQQYPQYFKRVLILSKSQRRESVEKLIKGILLAKAEGRTQPGNEEADITANAPVDIKVSAYGSASRDTSSAVNASFDGMMAHLDHAPLSLIVCAFTCTHDADVVSEVLQKRAPEVPMIGCTTCRGLVLNNAWLTNKSEFALGLWGLSDKAGSFTAIHIQERPPAHDLREVIISKVEKAMEGMDHPSFAILLGSPGDEEIILEGMQIALGNATPIFGGSSADNEVQGKWRQIAKVGSANFAVDAPTTSGNGITIAIGLASCEIATVLTSGFHPTDKKGTVTKVDEGDHGRTILEVDGQPIQKVYEAWTGGKITEGVEFNSDGVANVLKSSSFCPLGEPCGTMPSGEAYYRVMHPAFLDQKNGSLTTFADACEGMEVVMLDADAMTMAENMSTSAKSLVVHSFDETRSDAFHVNDVVGALSILCGGLVMAIDDHMADAAEKLCGVLGHSKGSMGICCFGEQGINHERKATHGNLMFGVLLFTKRKRRVPSALIPKQRNLDRTKRFQMRPCVELVDGDLQTKEEEKLRLVKQVTQDGKKSFEEQNGKKGTPADYDDQCNEDPRVISIAEAEASPEAERPQTPPKKDAASDPVMMTPVTLSAVSKLKVVASKTKRRQSAGHYSV